MLCLIEGVLVGEWYEVVCVVLVCIVCEMFKVIVVEGKFVSFEGYDLSGKIGMVQVVIENGYFNSVYKSIYVGFFFSDILCVMVVVMVYGV